MWNASSIYIYIYIYLEIVWPYCVNTVDVLVFRRHKFPRTLQVFLEIQKHLVLFCRYESPRTRVHLCIFLPHLRTQRCVLMRFSRHKFHCTLPIMLTGCPEFQRTFRCNWTLHSRRTCHSIEIRFNVGFDFATILSSPCSSCILFAIVSGQLVELKF